MKRFVLLSQLCLVFVFADPPEGFSSLAEDPNTGIWQPHPVWEASTVDDLPDAEPLGPARPGLSDLIVRFRAGELHREDLVLLSAKGELSAFVGGSYFFINLSEMKIAGKIGGSRFELGPGQQTLVQPAASHQGGGCQVTLSYQLEEQWKVFRNTRWSTNQRYRSLVFFHQEPDSERLVVSPVVEMLPYEP